MIDTHAHIFLEQFQEDLDETLIVSKQVGVEKILMPNIDSSTTDSLLRVATQNVECLPMMGLHPCSVRENFMEELDHVQDHLATGNFIAVGEIGTDLYWDKTFWKEQKEAFNIQCQYGLDYDLPVVIHCRETIPETIELIKPWADKGLTGVFHCFTGTLAQANEITGLGFYLGIGGVATFKNGGLDKVIPHLDKEKVVLETDSPYLAPTPFRGKRNEPSYIKLVAEKVAEFWALTFQEVDEITTRNANKLFQLL